MSVIQEIASESSVVLNVNQFIHRVMPIMQKRLNFDRAMIMLVRNDSGTLEYVTSYGHTQEQLAVLKQARFNLKNPKAKGPFVKAVNEQRPFLVDDVDKIISSLSKGSKVFAETIASPSFICVPLVYNLKAFGILAVDNWNSKNPLTKSDIGILNGIASQIAAGIANADSFRKLQESEMEFRKLYKESKQNEQLYRSLDPFISRRHCHLRSGRATSNTSALNSRMCSGGLSRSCRVRRSTLSPNPSTKPAIQ